MDVVIMKHLKIVALATDNPNRFEVKVKTAHRLSVYSVKAKDSKQAVERYPDPLFSKSVLSLSYTS